MKNAV